MANNRIFYACEAVAIGQCGDIAGNNPNQHFPLQFAHGVQSLGVSTSFDLQTIYELGQVASYDSIETAGNIELTIEKVIDGWPLLYHMATSGALSDGLIARTSRKCNVAIALGYDSQDAISGVPGVEIFMSGMKVNGLTYTFPTDGASTESVTLVGSHKSWGAYEAFDNGYGLSANGMLGWNQATVNGMLPQGKSVWNEDYPIGSGGIQTREDVMMCQSIMPVSIFGVNGTGVGNNWLTGTPSGPRAHITNISISIGSMGVEPIYELGRKEAYYQASTSAMEVTSDFEVLTVSGDFVNYVTGKITSPNQPIWIVLRDGTSFWLGSNNKLSSVSYGGGEAGGGNLTITYSFTNGGVLTVSKGPGTSC